MLVLPDGPDKTHTESEGNEPVTQHFSLQLDSYGKFLIDLRMSVGLGYLPNDCLKI